VFVIIEHMFASRIVLLGAALLAVLLVALGAARPSIGADAEARHVVAPGDTLWTIASDRYGGDVREAVWRIRMRNGLEGPDLRPGQVLMLP
jgi:nucleoid-associated protein YgaU